jgi:Fe-S-cluster-containing hydrogenase component 2
LCLACDPAPCAMACPTGSYTQRKSGGVRVDKSLCIRCGACAGACPVEAIYLEPESNLPYVCIHCGRCVPFCPHQCLALEPSPHEADEPGQAVGAGPGQPADGSAGQAAGEAPHAG